MSEFKTTEILDTKNCVCGLIFNEDNTRILLMRKNRPIGQIGKFNGIGGKIKVGETPERAIKREAFEETTIVKNNWKNFAVMDVGIFIFFFSTYGHNFNEIRAKTDELLYPFDVKDLFNRQNYFYHDFMINIPLLTAMAIDDSRLSLPINLKGM